MSSLSSSLLWETPSPTPPQFSTDSLQTIKPMCHAGLPIHHRFSSNRCTNVLRGRYAESVNLFEKGWPPHEPFCSPITVILMNAPHRPVIIMNTSRSLDADKCPCCFKKDMSLGLLVFGHWMLGETHGA